MTAVDSVSGQKTRRTETFTPSTRWLLRALSVMALLKKVAADIFNTKATTTTIPLCFISISSSLQVLTRWVKEAEGQTLEEDQVQRFSAKVQRSLTDLTYLKSRVADLEGSS